MQKEIIEIEVKSGEAVKDLKNVNKEIQTIDKTTQQANKSTETLGTKAVEGAKNFKIMGVSINDVSKGLKVLKVSLVATGIGAIVVAVGALAAAFLSTQAGIDKLNKVLVPAKEVLETIWGIAQKLGTSLFKIVSGDVKDGFNEIKETVKGVGDELSEAVKRGNELYELQIKIRDNGIADGLVLSRLNRLREDISNFLAGFCIFSWSGEPPMDAMISCSCLKRRSST